MKKEYSKPTLKATKIPSTVMLTMSFDEESGGVVISNDIVDDENSLWSGPW